MKNLLAEVEARLWTPQKSPYAGGVEKLWATGTVPLPSPTVRSVTNGPKQPTSGGPWRAPGGNNCCGLIERNWVLPPHGPRWPSGAPQPSSGAEPQGSSLMPRDPGWTHHEVQAYRPKEAAGWLRAAGDGERHRARFDAGKRAGRLAAGGYVGEGWAVNYLVAVGCLNSSWPPEKVRQDIATAARCGLRHPWVEAPPGRWGDPGPGDEDLR